MKLQKSGVVLGMENKHFVGYEVSTAASIESEVL